MLSKRKPAVEDAEELENDEPEDEGYASFMAAFDFTPDDLAANRQGIVTERQREHLSSTLTGLSSGSRTTTLAGIVFLLVVYAIIFLWLVSDAALRRQILGDPFQLMLLLLAFIVPATALSYTYLYARGAARRLSKAPLLHAEGPVQLQRRKAGRGAASPIRVRIGHTEFSFREPVGSLFTPGAEYRIYYVKSGPYSRVLAVEHKAPVA